MINILKLTSKRSVRGDGTCLIMASDAVLSQAVLVPVVTPLAGSKFHMNECPELHPSTMRPTKT